MIGKRALSLSFGTLPFTDVFVPIVLGKRALSVRYAIPGSVYTDVFPIGIGEGANAIGPSMGLVTPRAMMLSKTHPHTSKKHGNRQAECGE